MNDQLVNPHFSLIAILYHGCVVVMRFRNQVDKFRLRQALESINVIVLKKLSGGELNLTVMLEPRQQDDRVRIFLRHEIPTQFQRFRRASMAPRPSSGVDLSCKDTNRPPESRGKPMEAHLSGVEQPFSNSEAVFAEMVQKYRSPETATLEHGEAERQIDHDGTNLLRVLLEDWMNLQARAVPAAPVVGSEGETRTHRRSMPRKLMSIFGPIVIHTREGFRAPGLETLCPVDAALNLPPAIDSHNVGRCVAELASMHSFDMVGERLGATTGATVGKRQLEAIARSMSEDFDRFYETAIAAPVDANATLLIGGVDGTGVSMRPEALREATRRQREREAEEGRWPKPKSTRDMRRNGMRMAGVSVVYEIAPYVRVPEDILHDLRPFHEVRTAKSRPRPQAKRVSASVVKPMDQVVRETFDEMQRRDPEHAKRWVILVDGGEHQLDCVELESTKRGLDITIVLDFIHVAQYVWGAAKVLEPEDEALRKDWVTDKLARILDGDASTTAAAMRRSATKRGLSKKDRAPIDTCANYLLKYGPYLRYDTALAEGLPITTGVIEGACRHLVKDRMAITGARWGLDTAEAVLRLRALAKSGDLRQYFEFHESLELQRNHHSRYANATPPPLARPGKPTLRVVR